MRKVLCVILVNGMFLSLAHAQALNPFSRKGYEEIQKLSAIDHQKMMEELHIDSLRPGYDGGKNSTFPPNVDEAKANPYPVLPNPLVLNDGKKVTTAKMWWDKRRPEIVKDFDEDIYGKVPKHTPKITWEIESTTHETKWNIPVIIQKIIGHVDNSMDTAIHVNIELTLTTPANAKAPVPVMMEFGFVFPPGFKFPPMPRDTNNPVELGWQQQVLDLGWGYAVLIPGSIQPDNGAGLTKGIIGLCNKGKLRKPDDWGTLRAWAWGADKVLDYFETDKLVNAKEIGIEGVSRYGKAALVTMAYYPEFAIALVGSSGKGGAALYRRDFGEGMGNLAGSGEYQWFCGNFLKYDAPPLTTNDLPVDSHELIAMCSPRPVFISEGSPKVEGRWEDDKGQFMAEAAASPVYKLLGVKGLGATEMPPMGTAVMSGNLAFRQHFGGHTDAPNWSYFLKFAQKYFK
jgi:(4-O-methyl)-D-glucuronate---lignin esterase